MSNNDQFGQLGKLAKDNGIDLNSKDTQDKIQAGIKQFQGMSDEDKQKAGGLLNQFGKTEGQGQGGLNDVLGKFGGQGKSD
ncbi:hypothetical protein DICA3_F15566 [Diutina catenulata]